MTLSEDKSERNHQEEHRRAGVPRLLTAKSVAELLNIPLSTLYEMVRQKRIGGVVHLGRHIRFDPEKLQAWIDGGGEALAGGWRHEAEE